MKGQYIEIKVITYTSECYRISLTSNGIVKFKEFYEAIVKPKTEQIHYPSIIVQYSAPGLNVNNDRKGYIDIYIPSLKKGNGAEVEHLRRIASISKRMENYMGMTEYKLYIDSDSEEVEHPNAIKEMEKVKTICKVMSVLLDIPDLKVSYSSEQGTKAKGGHRILLDFNKYMKKLDFYYLSLLSIHLGDCFIDCTIDINKGNVMVQINQNPDIHMYRLTDATVSIGVDHFDNVEDVIKKIDEETIGQKRKCEEDVDDYQNKKKRLKKIVY